MRICSLTSSPLLGPKERVRQGDPLSLLVTRPKGPGREASAGLTGPHPEGTAQEDWSGSPVAFGAWVGDGHWTLGREVGVTQARSGRSPQHCKSNPCSEGKLRPQAGSRDLRHLVSSTTGSHHKQTLLLSSPGLAPRRHSECLWIERMIKALRPQSFTQRKETEGLAGPLDRPRRWAARPHHHHHQP